MTIETQKLNILQMSRQSNIAQLTPWFDKNLSYQIGKDFLTENKLTQLGENLVSKLVDYNAQTGVSTVVLGMSGGVDSALVAALFKSAGWRVIGVTMPISQDPIETQRGTNACAALELEHLHVDLTSAYTSMCTELQTIDLDLVNEFDNKATKIRRGNIRARLRMITLYNLAAKVGGLVASTDNYSELAAGFWTLHGDVGDLAPIQSLNKSWEVPMLAKLYNVPEDIWRATPTDGLGIDKGDEAQLGATYLEWDIMMSAINDVLAEDQVGSREQLLSALKLDNDSRAELVATNVLDRVGKTWYKRMNPVNLPHYYQNRYSMLNTLDKVLFQPIVVK